MSFKIIPNIIAPFALIVASCNSDKTGEERSKLPPQPPIWVVSDANSEITLYPTIHILPPELTWKSEELVKRLADADEVWFEIMPGSENDPSLQKSIIELGFAPGSSLSSRLSSKDLEVLKNVVSGLGMPLEMIDTMQPWFVSTIISASVLEAKGFDPKAGVEAQLQPLVKSKKIRALETAKNQMEMLASIPDEDQMTMLRETLKDIDESVDELKEIAIDWSVGDVEDLEEELLDEMKVEMPVVYDALFKARNENWVNQIEEELKGSGTDFIAVGAGHLVGEDGVPAMLIARGYSVERL